MGDYKCVFSITQIKNEFGCEKGQLVTRRAGPDIACDSQECSAHCEMLYEHFKKIGLPMFDLNDDLLNVPHGVWARIQFGGLSGLHRVTHSSESRHVENIFELVSQAVQIFGGIEKIPYPEFAKDIQEYQLATRGQRRRGR